MKFRTAAELAASLELALENNVYEDLASKFFEHFVRIADAMNNLGGSGLWGATDGFYYDQLKLNGQVIPLRSRSLVGLLPIIAIEVLEEEKIQRLPGFFKRMQWFVENRPDLARVITWCERCPNHRHRMLAIPSRQRLESVPRYMLDESEFLSPFGIRSVSAVRRQKPQIYRLNDHEYRVDYSPGEGTTYLFGGNSNWRIRDKRGLDFHIEVDGGIAPETASIVREAGANVLLAGTSVLRVTDPAKTIAELRG